MVIGAIAALLLASLVVMYHFSRKALKEEAMHNAEQTLEGTVQQIDNILLSVEQATGNIYFHVLAHLDNPDSMFYFCRRIVESNPYIGGCAIAYEPNYLKGRELFMAYVHRSTRDSSLIEATSFANRPYNVQSWYTDPMKKRMPCWTEPLKNEDTEEEPLTSFCLPFFSPEGKPVAVLAVDVPIVQLSQIVLSAKPSVNGYTTLLGCSGSYIVHPDSNKLMYQTVFTQTKHKGTVPSVKEAAQAMVDGETGYKRFFLDGRESYVFYKPFERSAIQGRSMDKLCWSVGVIYPLDDIFGESTRMLYRVFAIAIVGLLLLFVACGFLVRSQFRPLRSVIRSAQRIADGVYDNPIPQSHRDDEIGSLQNNFRQMQESLAVHVSELEKLKATLNERGKGLREAYRKAREADRMKVAFLHNMSNQMAEPSEIIDKDVNAFCDSNNVISQEEADRMTEEIQDQAKTITKLLNQLFEASEADMRKEDAYG